MWLQPNPRRRWVDDIEARQVEIAGFGYEDKTLVIFDPGHTPVGKSYTIPTVRYANPWGYGQHQ